MDYRLSPKQVTESVGEQLPVWNPLQHHGSPQGCALSPLPFIFYTGDCTSTQPNSHIVKFADDTVLMSLLSGHKQYHCSTLQDFVEWCRNFCFELNVKKIKEVTFSHKRRQMAEAVKTIMQGGAEEFVYKYLGTIYDNLLRFAEEILKKNAIRDSTHLGSWNLSVLTFLSHSAMPSLKK